MKKLALLLLIPVFFMFLSVAHAGYGEITSDYAFKVGSYYLKMGTTVYVQKITGYSDRIKFECFYTEGDYDFPILTIQPVDTNVTLNRQLETRTDIALAAENKYVYFWDFTRHPTSVSIGTGNIKDDQFKTDWDTFTSSTVAVFKNSTLLAVKSSSTGVGVNWGLPEGHEEPGPGGSQYTPPDYTPPPYVPSPPYVPPIKPSVEPIDRNLVMLGVIVIVGVVLFASVSKEVNLGTSRKKWKRLRRTKGNLVWGKTGETKKPEWKRKKKKRTKWARKKPWK